MRKFSTSPATRVRVNLPALHLLIKLEQEQRDHERTRLSHVMSHRRIAEQDREISGLRDIIADEWVGPAQ